MKSFDLFDSLEPRISLSGISAHAEVAFIGNPTPKPEPDPGPLVPDDAPIVYPPTDPSGPVGPGAHFRATQL